MKNNHKDGLQSIEMIKAGIDSMQRLIAAVRQGNEAEPCFGDDSKQTDDPVSRETKKGVFLLNEKFIIMFLLLVAVNCGGSGPDCYTRKWENLPISVNINNQQEQDVIDGFNAVFNYEIFTANESGVFVGYDALGDVPGGDILGLTYLSCGQYITGASVYLDTSLDPEEDERDYEKVFAHELGHVLGMSHMNTGIMQRSNLGNPTETFDEALADEQFVDAMFERYPEIIQ